MSAPDHSANPGYRLTAGERRDDDPATWRLAPGLAGRLKTTAEGLLPAIVQEAGTGRVLMLAWMDEAALAYTLGTRRGAYWSRSRGEYWVKGMTSGHHQRVEHLALDCDRDTVLLTVTQTGAACHTGAHSCFDVEPLV